MTSHFASEGFPTEKSVQTHMVHIYSFYPVLYHTCVVFFKNNP